MTPPLENTCPICLNDHGTLAESGSCGHSFCTECLHQFFSLSISISEAESPNGNGMEEEEISSGYLRVQDLQDCNIEGIATLRGCPLCRCPMSLLDLKDSTTKKPLWKYSKQSQLKDTPLAGKTFATRRGIGYNSFHFPPFSDAVSNTDQPYFLWEEDQPVAASVNNEDNAENGSNLQPKKYYFQPGCFYFSPKRSFHGQILLPDAHGNPVPYFIILDFAANHRWVTGGIMVRRPTPVEQRKPSTHPLEGRWKVTWYKERFPADANPEEQPDDIVMESATINIVDNCVIDAQSVTYKLRYEPHRIYFHWPGYGVEQILENDFRPMKSMPDVGEYLRWTTTDPDQPYILWQRESIADLNVPTKPQIAYFGRSGDRSRNNGDPFLFRNTSQTWYREWRPNTELPTPSTDQQGRPPYYKDRLWGNTFCQGLKVGLASYHFGIQPSENENEEGTPFAYISYENDMCSQWPPLDDGSPIPPQVYFHNISLEQVGGTTASEDNPAEDETPAHYVFRGTIEWLQDYGTTWQNNERWEYEMHFDSEFTCIVSGTVHCVSPDNVSSQREEMSQFGVNLVYVNAGILNAFEAWMNDGSTRDEAWNDDPESNSEVYQRYTRVSRNLRRRLQSEGASVRTVAMLNMIFTHSLQPGSESPIDYNV